MTSPSSHFTFVFTDIVDHTRMNRTLGDSAYQRHMLDPHRERIREAIARFEGHESIPGATPSFSPSRTPTRLSIALLARISHWMNEKIAVRPR